MFNRHTTEPVLNAPLPLLSEEQCEDICEGVSDGYEIELENTFTLSGYNYISFKIKSSKGEKSFSVPIFQIQEILLKSFNIIGTVSQEVLEKHPSMQQQP